MLCVAGDNGQIVNHGGGRDLLIERVLRVRDAQAPPYRRNFAVERVCARTCGTSTSEVHQVCEKWLKDRKGRRLSKDDIAYYQKIVVALSETIRLMKEIDEVIERHGGWPEAFQTGEAKAATGRDPRLLARPQSTYTNHGR